MAGRAEWTLKKISTGKASNRAVNFGLTTGTIYTANGQDGTTKFGNKALYNNYLGIGDWLPRIGLAWTPSALGGKTVIRAGAGLYYENSIFNNNLFNRPGRLSQGLFLSTAVNRTFVKSVSTRSTSSSSTVSSDFGGFVFCV